MILLLDHEDSFVYTLARYVAELGAEPEVLRVSEISIAAIGARAPTRIILSPGPGTPEDWRVTADVVRVFSPMIPTLGVCLGHQCIAAAYGASVLRSHHPRHGQTSVVEHDGAGVFAGVPSPFRATRYHSLAVAATTLPADLMVTATADDGEVMGLRHRVHPVEGVQFHPESVLTEWGHRMLANFLGIPSAGFGSRADQAPLCFAACLPAAAESSRSSR